jgi:hypothetical protein
VVHASIQPNETDFQPDFGWDFVPVLLYLGSAWDAVVRGDSCENTELL